MFNLAGDPGARPCVAVSSLGSVENIRQVESGAATFALTQADVADAAVRGEGPFAGTGRHPGLRTLIALYPEALTIVARADAGIREFQDLRGKRVGVGKSGAGYPFTRDVVLAAYGWTTSDFGQVLELDPAAQEEALCGNKVDAVFLVAGHPNGLTQGVTTGCRARLVRIAGEPVDRLLATHPDYTAAVIPGGMYPGSPEDVPIIATRALLVTSRDLPDDLARALVKAVFENFDDFRRLHPVLRNLQRKDMVPGQAVMPVHPGALAYYREAGLAP
jgi:TRAP transporter TAXI family solute receptor